MVLLPPIQVHSFGAVVCAPAGVAMPMLMNAFRHTDKILVLRVIRTDPGKLPHKPTLRPCREDSFNCTTSNLEQGGARQGWRFVGLVHLITVKAQRNFIKLSSAVSPVFASCPV